MIAYLEGRILELTKDRLLLLTDSGVGYQISVTSFCCESLREKSRCSIWIYTCVREDSISLFGFTDLKEKALFESLITVDRLGPKLAIKLLSASPFSVIFDLIKSGDVKGLSKLPGLGLKKAEQIVLKLKGSVLEVKSDFLNPVAKEKIVSALVNLGFKQSDVENVVSDFKSNLPVKEAIKKGLSILSGV